MVSIFSRNNINRALLSATLVSFTLTYPIQVHSAPPPGINLNDVAFFVKLEKVVEKLIKSEGKPIDKIIECFVDVKHEIEVHYNTKLDTEKYMKDVEKEFTKNGIKPPKKELDSIRKKIKDREKKNNKHAKYVAAVIDLEGYQMNQYDEDAMFPDENQFLMKASKGKDKDKDKDDKEEIVLPSLLVYGVTVSLCGLFLMVLPIPACKDWGGKMVVAGITACANSLCSENDKNKDKDKDKK